MAENRKSKKQIPEEAIKGAAGQEASFTVASISNEQILANSDKGKYETRVTGKLEYTSMLSTELKEGSTVKAYDNVPKENKKQQIIDNR